MQRRYEEMLTARLENVLDAGCARVLWNELYRWYEMKKIAAGTYRDLETRWQEVSEGECGQLKCVKDDVGMFMFAEESIEAVYEGSE